MIVYSALYNFLHATLNLSVCESYSMHCIGVCLILCASIYMILRKDYRDMSKEGTDVNNRKQES